MHKTNHKSVLMLMLTVCMLVPFGMDVFLAGLPQIQQVFSVGNVGTMLSAYLLGLALGQLFYGPLYDYFGRKPVLLVGLLIYLIGVVIVLLSPTYKLLLIGRFIQAIGACSAAVAAMAIVRDSFPHKEVAKYIAVVFGIIAVCPVLSPVIGSYLQAHFGWKGSFVLLLVFSVFYLGVTLFLFKESMLEKNKHALHVKKMVGNYVRFMRHREYFCFTMISCFSYAALFSYVSVASLVYIKLLGFGVEAFGWLFLSNTVVILIMNFAAPTLSGKFGLKTVLLLGVALLVLGVALLVVLINTLGFSLLTFMIGILVMLGGVGMIRPTAAAGAMHIFPKKVAGSASALFLFFSFIGGMVCTSVSGYLISLSVNDFLNLLAVLSVFAVIVSLILLIKPKVSFDVGNGDERAKN